jgi:hypothetical protein
MDVHFYTSLLQPVSSSQRQVGVGVNMYKMTRKPYFPLSHPMKSYYSPLPRHKTF